MGSRLRIQSTFQNQRPNLQLVTLKQSTFSVLLQSIYHLHHYQFAISPLRTKSRTQPQRCASISHVWHRREPFPTNRPHARLTKSTPVPGAGPRRILPPMALSNRPRVTLPIGHPRAQTSRAHPRVHLSAVFDAIWGLPSTMFPHRLPTRPRHILLHHLVEYDRLMKHRCPCRRWKCSHHDP